MDATDIVKSLDDITSSAEIKRILETAKTADDLKNVTKGPIDDVMGPIGKLIDGYTTVSGVAQIYEGATEDGTDAHDDIAMVDGIHDVLDGGSGLLGNLPGSPGAAFKAANAGFMVGDMIAPYVYNAHENEGRQMIDVPEDGEFHAETGNDSVDAIIEGGRDISDGDYGDAALNIAEGAYGVVTQANPAGAVADVVGDVGGGLYKWATE